jgi:predicted metalloendopeptidase
LHVNVQLTLGENLADIGGLAIVYDAFKMTKQGQGNEIIDGFTPNQRFFPGYAQVWRIKGRDESRRASLNTDPHSPEMYRVNGPLLTLILSMRHLGLSQSTNCIKKQKIELKSGRLFVNKWRQER